MIDIREIAINSSNERNLRKYSGLTAIMGGTGKMANYYMPVLEKLNIKTEAVCSRNLNNAEKFSKKYGIQYFYDDWDLFINNHKSVDLIIIAVSHLNGTELLLKTANKFEGYILVEKPVVIYPNDIARFNLGNIKYNKIIVGVNRRFYTSFNKAKLFFDLNGGINQMIVELYDPLDVYRKRGNYPDEVYNNWLIVNGVHYIDLFRFYLGHFKSIINVTKRDDFYLVELEFERSIGILIIKYNSGQNSGFKLFNNSYSGEFYNDTLGSIRNSKNLHRLIAENVEIKFKPGIYSQLKYVLDCILHNSEITYPASNLSDHFLTMKMLFDINDRIYKKGNN
jgi:predicted dehydrogenase